MFGKLKQHFHELKASPPGRRFQDLHERRAHRGKKRKPLMVGFGIVLILAGALMLIAPGPGLLAIAVGIGIIAQELPAVARTLDALELRVRGKSHDQPVSGIRKKLAGE